MTSLSGLPWVCLVTSREALDGGLAALPDIVRAALEGGVNVVQLREPGLPASELYAVGRRLRELTRDVEALLIVNDRVDVALAIGADGVQLGTHSLPLSVARPLAGQLLVGRSVHDMTAAVEAEAGGADFLVLGTIFASASHPAAQPAGPHLIQKVRARDHLPIIAIGGITAENAAQAISAGASGVAVIGAVLRSPFPRLAAQKLVEAVREAWPSAPLHKRT